MYAGNRRPIRDAVRGATERKTETFKLNKRELEPLVTELPLEAYPLDKTAKPMVEICISGGFHRLLPYSWARKKVRGMVERSYCRLPKTSQAEAS